MKITKSQLKHIIKEELLLIMETNGMMRYAPITGQRIQLAPDEGPTMQQMMQRDFDRPETRPERRASYSQPTMSADRDESGRVLTRHDPAREATPRPENLPAQPGDVDYRLPSARRIDTLGQTGLDIATTAIGGLPGAPQLGRAVVGQIAKRLPQAAVLGRSAAGRAADATYRAATGRTATAAGTETAQQASAEYVPGRGPVSEHVQRIIEEELSAFLNEQLPQLIPQDIPTDGAKPEPPPIPALTRAGRVLTPDYLGDLGFDTEEEYFEANPEHSPEYAAEPELMQRYGGFVPMGERGATILRQTGQDL